LTPEAETRLAIRTVPVEERQLQGTRRVGGEVVVPAGHAVVVNAPMAGTIFPPTQHSVPSAGSRVRKGQAVFRLRPLPGAAELSAAAVRLEAARAKMRRTEQLLEAGASSVRAVEEARAELAAAESVARSFSPASETDDAALLVLSSPEDGLISALRATPGQSVAASAPLFEVVPRDPLWVRVPVFVGDSAAIEASRGAVVHLLSDGAGAPGRRAAPVTGPPSADPLTSTTDLYFETSNADGALRPGQRVDVSLPLRQPERARVVPWSAVVFDVQGGAWVYENTAPHVFVRRRVDLGHVDGDFALLAGGLPQGAMVVSVGAAELFGTELGSGK
jgi:RND family efflux transporter MFP subunit